MREISKQINGSKKAVLGFWWTFFSICVILSMISIFIHFENRVDLEIHSPISDALIIKSEFEFVKSKIDFIITETISKKISEHSNQLLLEESYYTTVREEIFDEIEENVRNLDLVEGAEIIEDLVLEIQLSRPRNIIEITTNYSVTLKNYLRDLEEQIDIARTTFEEVREFQTRTVECTQINFNKERCKEQLEEKIDEINSLGLIRCRLQEDLNEFTEMKCNLKNPPYFEETVQMNQVNRQNTAAQILRVDFDDIIKTVRDNGVELTIKEFDFPEVIDLRTGYFIFLSNKEEEDFKEEVTFFEDTILEEEGDLIAITYRTTLRYVFEEEDLGELDFIPNVYAFDMDYDENPDLYVAVVTSPNFKTRLDYIFDLENEERIEILIVDNKVHRQSSILDRGQFYTYTNN